MSRQSIETKPGAAGVPYDQRLAAWLVRPLVRLPVTPNQLTGVSFALAAAAAWTLSRGDAFALGKFHTRFEPHDHQSRGQPVRQHSRGCDHRHRSQTMFHRPRSSRVDDVRVVAPLFFEKETIVT